MIIKETRDPLSNIDVAIKNVRWVMKSGQVVVDKTAAQSTH